MATRRRTPEQADASGGRHPAGSDSAAAPDPRLAELEASLAEEHDRLLRTAADLENFRKRSRQDQIETIRHANQQLLERLLPALDDLHLALAHAPEGVDEGWRKGLELALQKVQEVLEAHGVTPIETVGAPFDPSLHEAVGSEESDQYPDDTVIRELRRGYRLHDRVVRPALVKVSRQPGA
jgi:molecular chaperone GrpE